jgi:hypothetical protein
MPDREPDYTTARYLWNTYGPFDCSVVDHSRAVKCDLCRARVLRVMEARSKSNDKAAVTVCFENGCAGVLVGRQQAHQVLFGVTSASGLAAATGSDSGPAEELSIGPEDTRTLRELVDEARTLWENGLGRGWRIVPDLLEQYSRRYKLSPKQKSVLVRYVRSCAEELAKED